MIKEGVIISPSIASANQLYLSKELERIELAGCRDLHIDIEDGVFVPNITFGYKTVKALRSISTLPFSFHLMTAQWQPWLTYAVQLNASIVFTHLECLDYPKRYIGMARELGLRCGLALNPVTSIYSLDYLIEQIDGVLLLAVEPDGMGELFIQQTLQKARQLRQMNSNIELWIDGNITQERLNLLASFGITHAVMGRDFFNGGLLDD